MDLNAELVAPCTSDELYSWVDDLSGYPRWLGIVERAERLDDGPEPAWTVDLVATIGPFARSKRLRMVRTERDAPRRVVFERRELDGREHGAWRLTATVDGSAGDGDAPSARLRMDLHYGGRLWGPVLEPVLAEEIERSRARLLDLVVGSSAP